MNHKNILQIYELLFPDARLQLENSTMDAESKSLIRQLKHKLEDVQSSEKVCQRAKHAAETELADLTSTLEDVRAKNHEILEMYGEVVDKQQLFQFAKTNFFPFFFSGAKKYN
jgi:hypothetical protein